ncbi:type II toxin-antitoxin system HicA family toxin [Peptoniphilaceae bacterium SGI.137]|nr:type II toxin-antitoxin system HicA family toxin [Peptoniphilaceae bacterium]
MSGKELLNKLLKMGWREIGIKGSHHKITNGIKTTTIPVHGNKDLDTKTLNSILKQTGLK